MTHACNTFIMCFFTIELQGVVVAFAEELGFAEAELFPWS